VGDRDPLNGGLAFTNVLVQRFKDSGHTDVTYKTYAEDRHEIPNEINRDEVEADLLAWIVRFA
jgi:alpha-beta hydrolase superfamily lysophospholipase